MVRLRLPPLKRWLERIVLPILVVLVVVRGSGAQPRERQEADPRPPKCEPVEEVRAFAAPAAADVNEATRQIWIIFGAAAAGVVVMFALWWWFYEPLAAKVFDRLRPRQEPEHKPRESDRDGSRPRPERARGSDDDERDEHGRYLLS